MRIDPATACNTRTQGSHSSEGVNHNTRESQHACHSEQQQQRRINAASVHLARRGSGRVSRRFSSSAQRLSRDCTTMDCLCISAFSPASALNASWEYSVRLSGNISCGHSLPAAEMNSGPVRRAGGTRLSIRPIHRFDPILRFDPVLRFDFSCSDSDDAS